LGSIHLCAVFGGNVMTGDSALLAELRFAVLTMKKIDKTRLSPWTRVTLVSGLTDLAEDCA
jgi:hypothetical protein